MKEYVNLVVFIDGSGNDATPENEPTWTNVARLWNAARKCRGSGEVEDQRTFYRKGVGTRRGELIRGSYFGRYLCERVKEAKTWLEDEISIAAEAGKVPRIFLFGFSRGAYAVRVLANELNHEVWFMGVWDTVKATLTGPDVEEAGTHIKHIYHAMALDEYRKLFDVTRFGFTMRATEVWFPGCHADVGGGYEESELAMPSLHWMTRIAEDYGLLVDWDKVPRLPSFEVMPVMHDETRRLGWQIVGLALRDSHHVREVRNGDLLHKTVEDLQRIGYKRDIPAICRMIG